MPKEGKLYVKVTAVLVIDHSKAGWDSRGDVTFGIFNILEQCLLKHSDGEVIEVRLGDETMIEEPEADTYKDGGCNSVFTEEGGI